MDTNDQNEEPSTLSQGYIFVIVLSFSAVNACFPTIKSVFRGVKHRFRGEDWTMQLRG